MDFNDSPEEAEYRTTARAWLDKNAKQYLTPPPDGLSEADNIARSKKWQASKAEGGYAAITWPKEFGGAGGTPMQKVIYEQEESGYFLPANIFSIGLGMCIPTMMAYASPEQLEHYVPRALKGEDVWCQLFSEPAGGSDLAALRTKAIPDGDDWIINGQKTWTSGAQIADYGIVVTRTDPDLPKHKGMTMFYLDMKSPGIKVKPIKQASGAKGFNEVFFADVRIPDSQRLGDVNDGWNVCLTTLMNERLSISENAQRGVSVSLIMELAQRLEDENGPLIRNKAVRAKIAEWHYKYMGLRNGRYRTMTALSQGARPGPESSINKAVNAPMLQDIAMFGLDLMDQAGVMMDPDLEEFRRAFSEGYQGSPGLRIAGGTDEVMKNIIAERVLGMPGDIRVDKGIPFKDIPTGPS